MSDERLFWGCALGVCFLGARIPPMYICSHHIFSVCERPQCLGPVCLFMLSTCSVEDVKALTRIHKTQEGL